MKSGIALAETFAHQFWNKESDLLVEDDVVQATWDFLNSMDASSKIDRVYVKYSILGLTNANYSRTHFVFKSW